MALFRAQFFILSRVDEEEERVIFFNGLLECGRPISLAFLLSPVGGRLHSDELLIGPVVLLSKGVG